MSRRIEKCHICKGTGLITVDDWLVKGMTEEQIAKEKEEALADVVEVVRCKDCKHCDVIYPLKCAGAEAITVYFCGFNNVPRKADDFCSYGERKE